MTKPKTRASKMSLKGKIDAAHRCLVALRRCEYMEGKANG